ncbi:MAG TPA: DUF3179 domain-containing protein [Trueperaceae bacterium]|nr:DUF3179 domain-containing protein [Trueperaceae bacterium]
MKKNRSIFLLVILSIFGFALAQRQPRAMQEIGVDASISNIPIDEVLSGGPPPQGIPGLGFSGDWKGAAEASRQEPIFVPQNVAKQWIGEDEPIAVLSIGDETKAYPIQILTWHEIINDTIGGRPVTVSFCPLCNSTIAFDRRIPLSQAALDNLLTINPDVELSDPSKEFLAKYKDLGEDADSIVKLAEVTFGVSGMLYNSNLLMFDTVSSTLWSQILAQGNVGTLTNTQLLRIPTQILSFSELQESFPKALVLSRDTGHSRRYGSNPYVGYDLVDSRPFLFDKLVDDRMLAKTRIVSVEIADEAVAYKYETLAENNLVNDLIADKPIVVFWQAGLNSALDASQIKNSKDVGEVGVFSRELNGKVLEFEYKNDVFKDKQTGSTWNILGQAIDGELKGSNLDPIIHDNTLWFAWAAFKPETRVYAQ